MVKPITMDDLHEGRRQGIMTCRCGSVFPQVVSHCSKCGHHSPGASAGCERCVKPTPPTSLTEVIGRWPTIAAFAADLGVPYETAYFWGRRHSLPFEKALAVVRAARARGYQDITLECLAGLAERPPSNEARRAA